MIIKKFLHSELEGDVRCACRCDGVDDRAKENHAPVQVAFAEFPLPAFWYHVSPHTSLNVRIPPTFWVQET